MRALQISLHALGTEHAAVERKLLPRLKADHLVVLHLELDAALLAAEAAVRFDEPVRLDRRGQALADMRARCGPNCSMIFSSSAGIVAMRQTSRASS